MYFYVLIACLTLGFSGLLARSNTATNYNLAHNEENAIAGNMLVYRNYVIPYALANPAISGVVADSSLNLPTWFNRNTVVTNYVTAGKGYVYYAGTSSDLPYNLLKAMNNSINAGININGNLINPLSSTNTTIPISLPAAIPANSVVLAP